MTWLLKLRVVVAIALGGLILGGCSSSDDDAAAGQGSADPTPSASSPAGSTSPAAVECQVEGYIPRTAITARHIRPVVVYAHRVSLAPGTSMRTRSLELARADPLLLKVRPDDRSVELPVEARRQILASGDGPLEDGRLVDTVYAPVRLENVTRRNQDYLAYRGSFLYSGEWKIRACGAPYNDGTEIESLTGTYATVTRIRPLRVASCGAPASDTELDRYAARRACRDF